MKEVKYIEKEPLIAWLENMCVSNNIIEAIKDENRFHTVSVLKINTNDFPKRGDSIYYVNRELGMVEHGDIYSLQFKNGEIASVGVLFRETDDFDEFDGSNFGECLFLDEEMARSQLINCT